MLGVARLILDSDDSDSDGTISYIMETDATNASTITGTAIVQLKYGDQVRMFILWIVLNSKVTSNNFTLSNTTNPF